MLQKLLSLCLSLSGKPQGKAPPRRRPAFRRPSCRPRLEGLEDRVTPSLSYSISTLASFDGANGTDVRGLIMDGSGNLYGTTTGGGPAWNPQGGNYGDGTVFEVAAGSDTITTLASFSGSNGVGPNGGKGKRDADILPS